MSEFLGSSGLVWLPEEAAKARLFDMTFELGLSSVGQEAGFSPSELLELKHKVRVGSVAAVLLPIQKDVGRHRPLLARWEDVFGEVIDVDSIDERIARARRDATLTPLSTMNVPPECFRRVAGVLKRFQGPTKRCLGYWWIGALNPPEDELGWAVAEGTAAMFIDWATEKEGESFSWFDAPTLLWDVDHRWMVCASHDLWAVYVIGRSRSLTQALQDDPGLEVLDARHATRIS